MLDPSTLVDCGDENCHFVSVVVVVVGLLRVCEPDAIVIQHYTKSNYTSHVE